ncbi:MAG: lipopolysaccharide biosynthesis protein [Clostridia bacterium]|nr:lipopolysaccharide biosynthesis protein [Clostridia bacterium]
MGKREEFSKNFFWRFFERTCAQMVATVVGIVLARLLAPEAFGTVSLINVFIAILQVFVDSGLGNALIQKKNADNIDFSTVFFTNMFVCTVLYIGLFFAAPLIAKFYNNPDFTKYTRVLGLVLILSGVKNLQQAYVSKQMIFKKFFYATLGGTITAGVVGIILAYLGFGAWAIIAQHLVNLTIDTLVLWITVKWRPQLSFSFKRLKGLYSFGWKMLASGLLTEIYDNIRSLLIGKKYSEADLAYYNQGRTYPSFLIGNINSSINSVLFPMMSKEQDSVEGLKAMTKRSITVSTYLLAPVLMGFAAVSKSFVTLVLTEKWLPTIPYIYIFCFTFMFSPIHTANLNAIKALGRSDLFLKLEIIKKVVGITLLLISFPFGPLAMAYSALVASIMNQVINSWPNKKLLKYRYLEQIKDICPNILKAVFMALCVYSVNFLHLNSILTLIIQIPLGGIIYVSTSVIFKNPSFFYIWGMVGPKVNEVLRKFFKRNKTNS